MYKLYLCVPDIQWQGISWINKPEHIHTFHLALHMNASYLAFSECISNLCDTFSEMPICVQIMQWAWGYNAKHTSVLIRECLYGPMRTHAN